MHRVVVLDPDMAARAHDLVVVLGLDQVEVHDRNMIQLDTYC